MRKYTFIITIIVLQTFKDQYVQMVEYCHLNGNNFLSVRRLFFGGCAMCILYFAPFILAGSAPSISHQNCGSAPVRGAEGGAEVLTSGGRDYRFCQKARNSIF